MLINRTRQKSSGSKVIMSLILVSGLSTTALAEPVFIGTWKATARPQGAEIVEILEVTKTADGYAIAAHLDGQPANTPQAGPGTDIVVEGNHFSYKRSVPMPGNTNGLVISYKGDIEGDTFSGSAEMAAMEVPYTGVRITGEE